MSEQKKIKWKNTLNLPKTEFPMKARLSQKEPEILKNWDNIRIYEKILKGRDPKHTYILHDGPPYANGNIHLGHALNKILKDFVVKSKSMKGYYAPYVPGWDCHGLPIEIKVDKQLGSKKKNMSKLEIRNKCKDYAMKYIGIQKQDFVRLGVFGDWCNPYTTIDPVYESSIIEYFKSFVKKGNVYRKKRPVYWCPSCVTALAEAEVEYQDKTSPSIYVKFLLKDIPDFLKDFSNKDIYVMIWTTTPWTIPANLAIAVHPDFDYALFELDNEQYIAASRLIPVIAEIKNKEYNILKRFKGSDINGLKTKHPLYERDSIIINTNYVELETGTGCVHTAPGHGEEDYRAGIEYNLDIYSPVNKFGQFDSTTGKYEGMNIFKANPEIVEDLKNKNMLFNYDEITHSYPHCWRCKKPVIFRATEQWFIEMDKSELRKKALDEIKRVKWLPKWGEERISNMIENRPDWCISRQRDWGVPIPVFYCKKCGEPLLNVDVIDKVKEIFHAYGSNSWYEKEVKEFIPEGIKCSNCGNNEFEKGMDIIDVWFESGASWNVLEKYPRHKFPADMYLEGGDQYRGWFHSSLLVSISAREQSPYKSVITHGWVLDSKGRAMSKSMGNVISPQEIIKEKGAEILRLWVAMVNYREDIKLGKEILDRVTESYRKIRNTWRFMLGVLSDFNPDKDSLKEDELLKSDIYILSEFEKIKKKIINAYDNFEFHVIYHTLSNFFTVDLSSFYLNFNKDNLYCNIPDSKKRRSAQTTIFKLLKESLLLSAPILSFTAEEAWSHLPEFKNKNESVFLHTFPTIDENLMNKSNHDEWNSLLKVRDLVLKEIEEARNNKVIGDSLEADVIVYAEKEIFDNIYKNLEMLKEILVISTLNIKESNEFKIEVKRSEGKKCPRCWNYFVQDTSKNEYTELCPRCNEVILKTGISNEE